MIFAVKEVVPPAGQVSSESQVTETPVILSSSPFIVDLADGIGSSLVKI